MIDQDAGLDVNAKNVDEAIAKGLAQLGLSREQVEIEIIKEGRRGVFGIGAEDAVVRLTPRPVAPVPAPEVPISSPQSPIEEIINDEEQDIVVSELPDEAPSVEAPSVNDEPTPQITPMPDISEPEDDEPVITSSEELSPEEAHKQTAVTFLTTLLHKMGVEAMVTARLGDDLCEEGEDPPFVLDITGKDLGILIGRRNATLRALQYLVRLAVHKDATDRRPVLVDVESYRVRRRQSLRQLAFKMADQAITSRKRVVMESMSAYERRIVHVALRDNPSVRTKSIGGNDNRKVTIIPK